MGPRPWQPTTRPPSGPAPIQYISSNTLAGIYIQRPSQTTSGAREQGYPLLLHPALVMGVLVAFFILFAAVGVVWIKKWISRIRKCPTTATLPSGQGPPEPLPPERSDGVEERRPDAPVRLAIDRTDGSSGAAIFPLEDRSLEASLTQKDHLRMMIKREVVKRMQDVDLHTS